MTAHHWHSEPDKTTRRFAEGATFKRTTEGLQAALEVSVFPEGVSVVSANIIPVSGTRTIVQDTALMFADIDEAKDAIDLILDRLADEAGGDPSPREADEVPHERVLPETTEPEFAHMLTPLTLDPPATDNELEQLERHVSTTYGARLPDDYLAFLRTANGGDGDLENGASVVFWKAELLPRVNEDSETERWMPGMFIIGSDAGDALYGIDLRRDAPPERYVETFDVMEWDYVMWRGGSFLDLLRYLGRPHDVEASDSSSLGAFGRLLRGLRRH
jgi:SMI1/KNR4 family protein SUKH-1